MPQGHIYHIKNEFFELVNDKKLMANKENDHYRPHFFAVQDRKNSEIFWMIPMSSRVDDICILAYYTSEKDWFYRNFVGVINILKEIVGIKHIITTKATSIFINK